MNAETIASDDRLAEYCRWMAGAALIACDTEFVSEGRYRPDLCLVQLAVRHADEPGRSRLAVIDPLPIHDVRPFWEALAAPGHET
ncbi:MAG: ribonuclease D, partial [Planctomycetes bacterium]|nr:ribonuclease D [Planctomycetota bacterium]